VVEALKSPKEPKATERLVCGKPGADFELALVIKRTYRITPEEKCVLADEQVPIEEKNPSYEEDVPPPKVSPPRWDSDLMAFKEATDIVVQGHAYGYGPRQVVDVELRFGKVTRTVRVHGERRCDASSGRLKFTPALPFEKMPIRYDRAYGGFDAAAFEREGDLVVRVLGAMEPKWNLLANTLFHYPRNPAGVGYRMAIEEVTEDGSADSIAVPNLEFPFDLVTPERLAVGSPRGWLAAPLPAGFDWFDPGWFPRIGYLGHQPQADMPARDVQEVSQGWFPRELVAQSPKKLGWNPRFTQGASPGLAVEKFPADAHLYFRNLFPRHPERRVRLPGSAPKVTIWISERLKKAAETRLNAVIVQPDLDRVILVWSARCAVQRPFTPAERENMTWKVV